MRLLCFEIECRYIGWPWKRLSDLDSRLLVLLKSGQKIEAIKMYRNETGAYLRECKDYCEVLASRHIR